MEAILIFITYLGVGTLIYLATRILLNVAQFISKKLFHKDLIGKLIYQLLEKPSKY